MRLGLILLLFVLASVNSKRIKDIMEEVQKFLLRVHQDDIYQDYFTTYVDPSGYKNKDYGFLHFYTADMSEKQFCISQDEDGKCTYGTLDKNPDMPLQELKEGLIPRNLTYKRPLVKKPSVEFICIHDTGDNKFNASDWKEEVTTSERPTSWHFTVDDYEIYQHVPLDEVARHAGDGTGENLFKLTDTGVKYSGEDPELEFNTKDHHLYINGEKSENIMAIEDKDGWHHSITPAGLYITKGDNGNYFINNFYYNPTYGKLSNGGGNYNSIGIESCIFDGVSYSKVMRKFANLVAHLLNIYKLGTDRVMQHRNFSGKMCPQSMIRANEKSCFAYKNFKTLIEEEAFILNNFHDLKFEYFSNNPDIMDNNGFLLKYVEKETKISYTARVEVGEGQAVVKTFYTTIHPISKENRERMERMEKLKYMEK